MAEVKMNALIGDELARAPEMAAMLEAKAKAAAELAQQIAPVGDDTDPQAGQFRDSIHGELGERDGLPAGQIISDDPAAPYIIFGTSDTPPHDTLVRAVEGVAHL